MCSAAPFPPIPEDKPNIPSILFIHANNPSAHPMKTAYIQDRSGLRSGSLDEVLHVAARD